MELVNSDYDKSFVCGKLYAPDGYENPYLYCRIGKDAFTLVSVVSGNWWKDDMDLVDPNAWVDVTHLYELRRLPNGEARD
jgi:hypothetical protein